MQLASWVGRLIILAIAPLMWSESQVHSFIIDERINVSLVYSNYPTVSTRSVDGMLFVGWLVIHEADTWLQGFEHTESSLVCVLFLTVKKDRKINAGFFSSGIQSLVAIATTCSYSGRVFSPTMEGGGTLISQQKNLLDIPAENNRAEPCVLRVNSAELPAHVGTRV